MSERIIFHIDFDYFYAQCEEIRKPELKTKPVVVCIFSDRGEDSGAVATANYISRKHGVNSGLPIKFAKKRLENNPDAVFLPADFEFYTDLSSQAMKIIEGYADVFEYVGRDEAYLDVSKRTLGNYEKAGHIGQQIKNNLKNDLKLSCSIGISPNKLLSKIASDFKKPDGLTIIRPEETMKFLDPLEIKKIPGIGNKTSEKFQSKGIYKIGDVKKLDVFTLNKNFGRKIGTYIFNAVRGKDDSLVTPKSPTLQYSKIVTLKQNSKDHEFLIPVLYDLCTQLHSIVILKNQKFRSIGIQFIQEDLSSKTKSKMLKNSTSNLEELKKNAEILLQDALVDQELPIRRLGVKVSELASIEGQSNITNFF